MAEATSSTSSASGDQWAEFWGTRMNDPHIRQLKLPDGDIPNCFRNRNIQKQWDGLRLQLPSDILDLLNKTVGWDTPGDVKSAREMYTRVRDGLEDPSFNIEEELEKLKGLSSALGSKCDIFVEKCGQSNREYRDYCQTRVEKLVEQAPHIKDMPGYEHEITWDEKLWIELALRKKAQKVKQVKDCAIYLEDFREEVRPMAEKVGEVKGQLGNARRLLKGVNEFILILEKTKQCEFTVDKDKKRKRYTQGSQGYASREVDRKEVEKRRHAKEGYASREVDRKQVEERKEVDRKEVEESLLEVLKKASGKSLENKAADTEFMKKWDLIMNDFFLFSDYLRS
ncbi:hypothetical protein C5167_021865 [Papaver somniferum]|uniref:Uncharacterized protein n=1 Tax=Papaver somniferum TaxID=3469 RepID=A0A4Y7JKA4_PAPSO|nr:uncharacterized protein LOC113277255 [Papaver somniferum]RZC60105.1 hypothetical protein C5167_021865 [Papaver somniferum]